MSDEPLGPPPVDPMSEISWARVERGLMARLDGQATAPPEQPARRTWAWIAVPALAAAAVLLVVLALRGGDAPVDQPDQLADLEPSRVVAGDAPSSVSFGDAHLALEARSAIVMTHEGGSPSVLLERGASSFTVAPRAGRAPFVVRAGDTIVRVVGTQFRVARSDERVSVSVEHGIVDVQFRGNTVRVEADQEWHSETPEVVSAVAVTPVPTEPPVVASAEPVPANTEPPVVVKPGKTAAPITKAPITKIEPPVVVKTAPPVVTNTAPITKVEPPVVAKTAPTKVDPLQTQFERTQALEVRNPDAALAGYLEISKGNSKWSANALYAAGRLAADRNYSRAKTFLTIYLRRFPSGKNVIDVRLLLQRLEGEQR